MKELGILLLGHITQPYIHFTMKWSLVNRIEDGREKLPWHACHLKTTGEERIGDTTKHSNVSNDWSEKEEKKVSKNYYWYYQVLLRNLHLYWLVREESCSQYLLTKSFSTGDSKVIYDQYRFIFLACVFCVICECVWNLMKYTKVHFVQKQSSINLF